MPTLDEILRHHRLTRIELDAWVQQRWVRPQTTASGLVFDEVDEARIGLICELRSAFTINDEALGVVLSLLDQLYAARRVLRSVEDAVAALPEPVRAEFRARLRSLDPPG
jgi:chaperone modulatory protein CbpM